MKLHRLAMVGAGLTLALIPTLASAAAVIDREFRYGPERIHLAVRDGRTRVQVKDGMHEFSPGQPDLPSVGERIELPAGMKVVGVEVTALETAPLADKALLTSAPKVKPEIAEELTTPDAAAYARAGFQPESPVALGLQGTQRETNVAILKVWPVRWDATSGRLERVTRVAVRLTLAPGGPEPIKRERIVPEWENEGRAPSLETRAAASSKSARSAEAFRPTQLPSVLGSPVQYVIVTTDDQAAAYQALADWKTQSGQPAVVRTMTFIRQQYPFGSDDAERVRAFIKDAYARWGTQWVLLGGDTDQIPTRLAYTAFYNGEYIACDMYYSCLDGNWNADGDSLYGEGFYSNQNPGDNVDLLPEVYVGRAPTTNATEAQKFVSKTLGYIKTPVADYINSALFFAEVLFPQDWHPGDATSLDGAEIIEYDLLPILDTVPWFHYARLYENYTDARWRPGALPELRQTVIDSLDRGYNLAVHVGHGYRTVMSCGDANLTGNDAQSLTNGSRVMNLYAIDCTSNAIDFPCIGESFLHAVNGGAVTNVGSTRFDFPTAGRSYQEYYFELLLQDSVTAIGCAQAEQKLPFIAYSIYDGVNRWTQMTLLLLGDPSLAIYTNTPRILAVTAPASIAVSDTQFTVHVVTGGSPLYGARVTAYRANDEFASVLTDGAGNAVLPFRPDSIGSFTLTVTGFNCKPSQQTIPIVASGSPAFADQMPVIDDDNAGGTSGNGDGQIDAGEVVDVHVPLRNTGGSPGTSVTGTLTCPDPMCTITSSAVAYGSIAPGVVSNPAAGYRVSVPRACDDQHELAFTLRILDGSGGSHLQTFQLVVHAPDLRHNAHTVNDVGGISNGRPDPGETVSYFLKLKNLGTGQAKGLYGRLRDADGLATVSDSMVTWPDLSPGQEATGDAVVFSPSSANAVLELHVFDPYGEVFKQLLDMNYPPAPISLEALGAATSISLTWAHNTQADLLGYNVLRSANPGGPFVKVNANPTDRVSYYLDSGLTPLTRYYYEVTAVDSSGNESGPSAVTSASTNPPLHTIFPIPTGGTTPSPVTLEHMGPGYPLDIFAGSEVPYWLHIDGSAPVDADGAGTTQGDLSTEGVYYAGGLSVADLNGDGVKEIIGATFSSNQLFVFDQQGHDKPGFPVGLQDGIWSSVAIGDIDGDGQKEMVFGSLGNNIYAFHANGTEVMDGDANPTTIGIFKVLGQPNNNSTPALADLDGDGKLDIIYGGFDGFLYAWRYNGTSLPGFPVDLHGSISSSPAVGYLDGPSDTQLDIVVTTQNDSLFVIRADGSRHPNYPLWIRTAAGYLRNPSVALADMNKDGFLDIVFAGAKGGLYVFDHNGNLVFPWSNIRYSVLTDQASEDSPVVADINGDGWPDIVMGDETGSLTAFAGSTAAMLPGFPIQLGAEVKGPAGLCDCDGDGKTEIVVAGWDKNIYVWDYDFPFSPGALPAWPQFHHDSQRTGYVGTPILLGVDDSHGAAPQSIEFGPPAPNPARGGASRLSFGIPTVHTGERYELSVFDLSGRHVQTIERGIAKAGRFTTEWNLRDAHGTPVGNGVYFVRFTLGDKAQSKKLAVVR